MPDAREAAELCNQLIQLGRDFGGGAIPVVGVRTQADAHFTTRLRWGSLNSVRIFCRFPRPIAVHPLTDPERPPHIIAAAISIGPEGYVHQMCIRDRGLQDLPYQRRKGVEAVPRCAQD